MTVLIRWRQYAPDRPQDPKIKKSLSVSGQAFSLFRVCE